MHKLTANKYKMNNIKILNLLSFALVGSLLLALLLFLAQREDYWGDEGFTVRRVEASWVQLYHPFAYRPPDSTDPFNARYVYDFSPPLYFALVRIVAGPHPARLTLRLFSILPMLGMLGLLAWWAKRRFGTRSAMALAVIFCLSPPIIYYGHEARPYALGLLAATALLMLPDFYRGRSGRSFSLHLCAALICCLLHFHLAWLILTLAAIYAVQLVCGKTRGRRPDILARLGGLAGGSLLALLFMLPTRQSFAWAKTLPSRPLTGMAIFKTFFMPLISWDSEDHIQIALALAAAFVFCGLTIYLILTFTRDERSSRQQGAVWLALWLIPAGAPILAHLFLGQSFFERYSLFALPGWLMLLGWMIHNASLRSRTIKCMAAALVLLMAVNGGYWGWTHLRQPLRPSWQPALRALYGAERPGDLYSVQPDWLKPCFAANAHAIAQHPPRSSYTPLDADSPAGARRIWIIGSEWLEPDLLARLSRAGWRFEPAKKDTGIWLWRAER